MKHKKLSISIVSAFIAAIGLTACSHVSVKEDAKNIVTLEGSNGQLINLNTNEIYDKYKETEDGISSFYQAILEVLIRNHFETAEKDSSAHKDYESFKLSAEEDVKSDKKKARDNEEANKTDYDTEWKAILDAAGVEDEEGLFQHHLYKYEKDKYLDEYFEGKKESLTSEYIGYDKEGNKVTDTKANSMMPYHIRHVLVKTSAAKTDYVTGEITAKEAQNLNTVYEALASGRNTFGRIAQLYSEDGSASTFGDAGIMTTTTGFVNEFKLGVYAFDALYSDIADKGITAEKKEEISANKLEKLGLNGSYNESSTNTIKNELDKIKLGRVSYEVFEFLGDHYDEETNKNGLKNNKGIAKSFPRNVIWNNYLNLHNVFVISNKTIKDITGEDLHIAENYAVPTGNASDKTGFRLIPGLKGLDADEKVLTDEDGRVIIGVRSEFGIHFMIMERSPFEINGTITGYKGLADETYARDNVSINEYYTTYKPGDKNYPKEKVNDVDVDKVTYVNFMNSETSTYQDRAQKVKDEIKGFDKMYDYRIFESLIAEGKVKINDKTVAAKIDEYIFNKRAYNNWNADKTLNDAWNKYLDQLLLQDSVRKEYEPGKSRLVKPVCAVKFANGGSDFEKDGECYYEA